MAAIHDMSNGLKNCVIRTYDDVEQFIPAKCRKMPKKIQKEMFFSATQSNLIAVLDTGQGKTLIASLLVYYYYQLAEKQDSIIVFLAPTRVLVHQQAAVLVDDIEEVFGVSQFQVHILTGDGGDKNGLGEFQVISDDVIWDWSDPDTWHDLLDSLTATSSVDHGGPGEEAAAQVSQVIPTRAGSNSLEVDDTLFGDSSAETQDLPRVFVMTPGALLLCLVHGFIPFHRIALLVFDECHNATGQAPYNEIMHSFYHMKHPFVEGTQKPRILGLTACVLLAISTRGPMEIREDVLRRSIHGLQQLYDAQIHVANLVPPTKVEECFFRNRTAERIWVNALRVCLWEPLKRILEGPVEMLMSNISVLTQADTAKLNNWIKSLSTMASKAPDASTAMACHSDWSEEWARRFFKRIKNSTYVEDLLALNRMWKELSLMSRTQELKWIHYLTGRCNAICLELGLWGCIAILNFVKQHYGQKLQFSEQSYSGYEQAETVWPTHVKAKAQRETRASGQVLRHRVLGLLAGLQEFFCRETELGGIFMALPDMTCTQLYDSALVSPKVIELERVLRDSLKVLQPQELWNPADDWWQDPTQAEDIGQVDAHACGIPPFSQAASLFNEFHIKPLTLSNGNGTIKKKCARKVKKKAMAQLNCWTEYQMHSKGSSREALKEALSREIQEFAEQGVQSYSSVCQRQPTVVVNSSIDPLERLSVGNSPMLRRQLRYPTQVGQTGDVTIRGTCESSKTENHIQDPRAARRLVQETAFSTALGDGSVACIQRTHVRSPSVALTADLEGPQEDWDDIPDKEAGWTRQPLLRTDAYHYHVPPQFASEENIHIGDRHPWHKDPNWKPYNGSVLRCLVFCATRLDAFLLHTYCKIRNIARTQWLTSAQRRAVDQHVCGPTSKMDLSQQRQRLNCFRANTESEEHLNILFCTSVLAEGIDIQGCNCVVRFAPVKTVVDNIQGRGRIRVIDPRMERAYKLLLPLCDVQGETVLLQSFSGWDLYLHEFLKSQPLFPHEPRERVKVSEAAVLASRTSGALVIPQIAKRVFYHILYSLASRKEELELRHALLKNVIDSGPIEETSLITWDKKTATLIPLVKGYREDHCIIKGTLLDNEVLCAIQDSKAIPYFLLLCSLYEMGVIDPVYFLPPRTCNASREPTVLKKGVVVLGEGERTIWREIPACFRPSHKWLCLLQRDDTSSNGVLVNEAVNNVILQWAQHSLAAKTTQNLLKTECVMSVVKGTPPSNDEVTFYLRAYAHRVFYTVASRRSAVLASGGHFGRWRPFYMSAETEAASFNPWNSSTAQLEGQNTNLQIRSSSRERPTSYSSPMEVCWSSIAQFQRRIGDCCRVLQPLCLLLPSRLPETCAFYAYHDEWGEIVLVELEPISAVEGFGEINLTREQADNLQGFQAFLLRLLAVRAFFPHPTLPRLHTSDEVTRELKDLHARPDAWMPACFLVAPLAENGLELDWTFVALVLRTKILASSGQTRGEKRPTVYDPPSLLSLYRTQETSLFQNFLRHRVPGAAQQILAVAVHPVDTALEAISNAVSQFCDIPYQGDTILHDIEAWPLSSVLQRNLTKTDTVATIGSVLSRCFACRGWEPPVARAVHDHQRRYRFMGLYAVDLVESADSLYPGGGSLTLKEMYESYFGLKTTQPHPTLIAFGLNLRQGSRNIFNDTTHSVNKRSISSHHAPEYLRLLPLTDPIFQQITWLPGIMFRLEIWAKHYELRNRLAYLLAITMNAVVEEVAKDSLIVRNVLYTLSGTTELSDGVTAAPASSLATPFQRLYLDLSLVERALTTSSSGIPTVDIRSKLTPDIFGSTLHKFSSSPRQTPLGINKSPAADIAEILALSESEDDKVGEKETEKGFSKETCWHNERLEFFGDAILKCIVGIWAFFCHPDDNENALTATSTYLKSNKFLLRCCQARQLHSSMWTRPFVARSRDKYGSFSLIDLRRQLASDKMQASVVEALIAAVYISNAPHMRPPPSAEQHFFPKVAPKENVSSGSDLQGITYPLDAHEPRSLMAIQYPVICPEKNHGLNISLRTSQPLGNHRRAVGSNSGFLAAAVFLDVVMAEEINSNLPLISPVVQVMTALSFEKGEDQGPCQEELTNGSTSTVEASDALQNRKLPEHPCPEEDATFLELVLLPKLRNFPYAQTFADVCGRIMASPPEILWLAESFPFLKSLCSNRCLGEAWLSHSSFSRKSFVSPQLLTAARTRPSAVGSLPGIKLSYERLEFLGDSILGYLITEWLYEKFPQYREDALSYARSILQSNDYLARKLVRRLATAYPGQKERTGILPDPTPPHIAASDVVLYGGGAYSEQQQQAVDNFQISVIKSQPENDFVAVRAAIYNRKKCRATLKDEGATYHDSTVFAESKDEDDGAPVFRFKYLADVYESLIAAVYIDSHFNIQACWECIAIDMETSYASVSSILRAAQQGAHGASHQ